MDFFLVRSREVFTVPLKSEGIHRLSYNKYWSNGDQLKNQSCTNNFLRNQVISSSYNQRQPTIPTFAILLPHFTLKWNIIQSFHMKNCFFSSNLAYNPLIELLLWVKVILQCLGKQFILQETNQQHILIFSSPVRIHFYKIVFTEETLRQDIFYFTYVLDAFFSLSLLLVNSTTYPLSECT